jgi:hypothetical protein
MVVTDYPGYFPNSIYIFPNMNKSKCSIELFFLSLSSIIKTMTSGLYRAKIPDRKNFKTSCDQLSSDYCFSIAPLRY